MSYNGWSNYATWAVHLHLANTEWLYRAARETIDDIGDKYHAASELKSFVEELFDEIDYSISNSVTSLRSDLLTGALDSIDWVSIVEALKAE